MISNIAQDERLNTNFARVRSQYAIRTNGVVSRLRPLSQCMK